MMAINTVAAGGGSILHFDGSPRPRRPRQRRRQPRPRLLPPRRTLSPSPTPTSASARSSPRHFPAIFGPGGDQPRSTPTPYARQIRRTSPPEMGVPDPRAAAEGFLRVAVANMANAIKQVSVQKGHDPARFALQCFGGAGGQHACLVADELGMAHRLHPPLRRRAVSAYGMGLADQSGAARTGHGSCPGRRSRPPRRSATPPTRIEQTRPAPPSSQQGAAPGRHRGPPHRPPPLRRDRGRPRRSPSAVTRPPPIAAFTEAHRARFGFATPERPVVAELVAVEAVSPGEPVTRARTPRTRDPWPPRTPGHTSRCGAAAARTPTPPSSNAPPSAPTTGIEGPALIREANATTVVEPGWTAEVTAQEPHAAPTAPQRSRATQRGRRNAAAPTPSCSNCSTTCS